MLLERYSQKRGESIPEEIMSMANRHYIPSRYPNAHPSGTAYGAYDERVSERSISSAKKILEYVSRSDYDILLVGDFKAPIP